VENGFDKALVIEYALGRFTRREVDRWNPGAGKPVVEVEEEVMLVFRKWFLGKTVLLQTDDASGGA
jgi:hypothetical protein